MERNFLKRKIESLEIGRNDFRREREWTCMQGIYFFQNKEVSWL